MCKNNLPVSPHLYRLFVVFLEQILTYVRYCDSPLKGLVLVLLVVFKGGVEFAQSRGPHFKRFPNNEGRHRSNINLMSIEMGEKR